MAVAFIIPVGLIISFSFFRQGSTGDLLPGLTLSNYGRLFTVDLYRKAILTTLRVSVLTTVFCALLAYPVAMVMARGSDTLRRALTIIVIAPMLINVVVRSYVWRIILANGDAGILNWTLGHIGLGEIRVLYTEWAIVIGSVHFFLSTMVLPLAAALARIDPSVEEAARTLGATGFQVFRRVTLPLSVPGLAAGSSLVFSLTASSFVLPALLGGNFAKMLGPLLQEQILTVFDWPFGAALATILIAAVLIANFVSIGLVERRFRARSRGSA
jgi:putative spermidine/putrescine transport system permease protein